LIGGGTVVRGEAENGGVEKNECEENAAKECDGSKWKERAAMVWNESAAKE